MYPLQLGYATPLTVILLGTFLSNPTVEYWAVMKIAQPSTTVRTTSEIKKSSGTKVPFKPYWGLVFSSICDCS